MILPSLEWLTAQQATYAQLAMRIHQHPEIGFDVSETTKLVVETLESWGIEVTPNVGGGVVGMLRGNLTSEHPRSIAFRSELDALPMQEATDLHYRSKVKGVFHGCGHDGHTAILLALAHYLSEHRDFAGTVYFIFQPAEEKLSGAQAMIEDGLFERFQIDEVYGLHNSSLVPKGVTGIRVGEIMASADHMRVCFKAHGVHAAMPHLGQDCVQASAAFLSLAQQQVARIIDTQEPAVVSFCTINGGTAFNILPDSIELTGTIRTMAQATRDKVVSILKQAAQSVEISFGVEAEVEVTALCIPVVNTAEHVEVVTKAANRVAGENGVISNVKPVMAVDDFAYMLAQKPGAFFLLGQEGPCVHNPSYVFDLSNIPIGAAIFCEIAADRLTADRK